ncbi:MAG: hypothetical protein NZ529_03885 [Cytophagaceae bacterium]|nr:hypothetical protein [Cytophagaceae bacterium]MDW8455912.1 hypothetical protein [Cytophagaceae bacterium]
MPRIYIVFITTLLTMIYCKPKQTLNNTTSSRDSKNTNAIVSEELRNVPALLGEWIWYKTSCCGRNKNIMTPQTEGYTRSVWFKENNIAEFYKNSQLEKKLNYTISEKNERNYIKLDKNAPALLILHGDSLVLNYGYMDMENEYFVRKK